MDTDLTLKEEGYSYLPLSALREEGYEVEVFFHKLG